MIALVLSVALTQAPPLVVLEPARQPDAPVAERSLSGLTRGQLRVELRRTERQRPLVGWPALQLVLGALAGGVGAIGLGATAANPFRSEASLVGTGVLTGLGVGAVISAIWWLVRLWPEKREVDERIDAINDRMEELDEDGRSAPCREWPQAGGP